MFNKYRPISFQLDPNGPRGDSPEMVRRLQRIAQHYQEFEEVFARIEARLTIADEQPPTATDSAPVARKPK